MFWTLIILTVSQASINQCFDSKLFEYYDAAETKQTKPCILDGKYDKVPIGAAKIKPIEYDARNENNKSDDSLTTRQQESTVHYYRRAAASAKLVVGVTRKKIYTRTTPYRVSFKEDCDYLAYYCMKAYQTGKICGRTYYFMYHDFSNYCMLDYVNCMERQEVWTIAHVGECTELHTLDIYKHYAYEDDYFLDQYYVVDDKLSFGNYRSTAHQVIQSHYENRRYYVRNAGELRVKLVTLDMLSTVHWARFQKVAKDNCLNLNISSEPLTSSDTICRIFF